MTIRHPLEQRSEQRKGALVLLPEASRERACQARFLAKRSQKPRSAGVLVANVSAVALARLLAVSALALSCNGVLGINDGHLVDCVADSDCADGEVCDSRMCVDARAGGASGASTVPDGDSGGDQGSSAGGTRTSDASTGSGGTLAQAGTSNTGGKGTVADGNAGGGGTSVVFWDAGSGGTSVVPGDAGSGGTSVVLGDAGQGGTSTVSGGSAGVVGDAGQGGTSIFSGGGSAGVVGGAGSAGATCDEGELRCVTQAGTGRDICLSGSWESGDPCPDGKLCDSGSEPPGQCVDVPEVCRGRNPEEPFCDGLLRTVCGPDLVSVETSECASVQHCALATGLECAACLPGEHVCQGSTLQACSDDLSGFDVDGGIDCGTAPCNADAGECTELECTVVGQRRCNGDVLQECSEAFEYTDVATCDQGLCDPVDLECDACIAHNKECTEDAKGVVECSGDGQEEGTTPCATETPICTGAGLCVACTVATDCVPPNTDCYSPACNQGTGTCDLNPKGTNVACDGGVCNAAHQCVECTADAQCSAPDTCHTASCDETAGVCESAQLAANVACTDASGYCSAAGTCEQCTLAVHCPEPANTCLTRTCRPGNECGTTPTDPGESCSTGVCDGEGVCVECLEALDCSAEATVCHDQACVDAVHDAGWLAGSSPETSSVTPNDLFLKRLPRLEYPAKLRSLGIYSAGLTSASAKIALYADNGLGTGPTGARIAEAELAITTAGQKVAAAAPLPDLAANTDYWIAFKVNVSGVSIQTATGVTSVPGRIVVAGPAYGDAFQVFDGEARPGSSKDAPFAVFARVEDTE